MGKKYGLEKEVYFETIWYIRQYPKMVEEYEELMQGSYIWGKMKMDGMPHGTKTSDMVSAAAEKLADVTKRMLPIRKAIDHIPEEYHQGILDNIIHRKPYPIEADLSTWKRWKRRFVYWVAMERRKQ